MRFSSVRLSVPRCEAEMFRTVEFVTNVYSSESIVLDRRIAVRNQTRSSSLVACSAGCHRVPVRRPFPIYGVSRPGNFTTATRGDADGGLKRNRSAVRSSDDVKRRFRSLNPSTPVPTLYDPTTAHREGYTVIGSDREQGATRRALRETCDLSGKLRDRPIDRSELPIGL
jgi:hypothetical protein